tara:strand:- start:36 stop:788 length:753 start_codon:yes stop_codon:yes gene_type:complete
MSKYSKIIVGGCSFTDKDYPKTAKPKPLDFKMWPDVIGEMHNCEVINTARNGYGNHAIYHKTLQAIFDNLGDIEHVYIMWSEWSRQDFLITKEKRTVEFVTLSPRAQDNRYVETQLWYRKAFNMPYPEIKQLLYTNLNYIYSMQMTLKQLGIKYTFCQGTPPLPWLSLNSQEFKQQEQEVALELLKSPLIDKLDNFMGWPMIDCIGGYCIKELCELTMGSSHKVSLIDSHPNEKAHKFIASRLYEYSGKS